MAILPVVLPALIQPADAQERKTETLTIGYLELADDPRYKTQRRYTGLRLRERKRPVDGARLAVRSARALGRALGVKFALERHEGTSVEALTAEALRMAARKGVRFFLVDAPAPVLRGMASAMIDRDALLFNVSEPDDDLRRKGCWTNLMHTIPSRAMLMDGLVQYLVSKNWRKILVLKGPLPDDAVLADAFSRSARKFGGKIVAAKDFVLGHDPRNRDRNNIALMTASPSHDVVFLADTDGEFGRYVPFQTNRPRPVVGTEGLIAGAWHWTWERHGAPQLNQRFDKRAKRRMAGPDWAAWAAVRAIAEAVTRTRTTDFATLDAYLKGPKLTVDAYKGAPASFRPWSNQLRQPILLHTNNAIIARAPIKGFMHHKDNLDTLGMDERESTCKR